MATKFERDDSHIKSAYGNALYNAGFQNIITTVEDLDELLDDDDDIETFSRYISQQQFEADFIRTFRETRKNAIKWYGWWSTVDMAKFRVDPKWDETIRGYFTDSFTLSIKSKNPPQPPHENTGCSPSCCACSPDCEPCGRIGRSQSAQRRVARKARDVCPGI